MKSVFAYTNYLELLKDLIYGPSAERGAQSQLAKAIGCQASYLLQVMKEKAELTEDQGLRLARYLEYSELETEYLIILLRISRAGSQDLIQYLEKKRSLLLEQSSELENKVKSKNMTHETEFLARYFGSWVPATIHMATSSEKFQTPTAIAERLGLSIETVQETLSFLEQAQLVKKEGKIYLYSGESIHLPRKSDLNEIHQTGRRIQVLKSLAHAQKTDLHFSSLFTLDKTDLEEIKNILSNAIKKSHEKIHASGTEEIYGMCVDFFKVV